MKKNLQWETGGMGKMDTKKKKQVYSTVAGAFDPILRNWAQKIAATVPQGSGLRSDIFQSALGALKGLVEVISEKLPSWAAVLIEKGTDLGDFFTGALGGQEEKKVATEIVDGWMEKFFNEATGRLAKADDVQKEFEKIKLEFGLRGQLLKMIEEAAKAEPKKGEEPAPKIGFKFNWKEWKEKFKALAHNSFSRYASFADEKTAEALSKFNKNLEERIKVRREKLGLRQKNYRQEKE